MSSWPIDMAAYFSGKCCRRGSPSHPITLLPILPLVLGNQLTSPNTLSSACALFTCVCHWHPYPLYLNCQISGSRRGWSGRDGAAGRRTMADDGKCADKQAGLPSFGLYQRPQRLTDSTGRKLQNKLSIAFTAK